MQSRDPLGQHVPTMTAAFEASLFFIAVAVGWMLGLETTTLVHFNWQGVLWGVVAAAPLIVGFFVLQVAPIRSVQTLNLRVRRLLVPLLRPASLVQIVAICVFAGLGEEMLFRAVMQQGLQSWFVPMAGVTAGVVIALVVTALCFGIAHAMTPLYAIVAGLIGLYFGIVWLWTDNLLAPILAHALYDFVAILWYLHGPKRLVRRKKRATPS